MKKNEFFFIRNDIIDKMLQDNEEEEYYTDNLVKDIVDNIINENHVEETIFTPIKIEHCSESEIMAIKQICNVAMIELLKEPNATLRLSELGQRRSVMDKVLLLPNRVRKLTYAIAKFQDLFILEPVNNMAHILDIKINPIYINIAKEWIVIPTPTPTTISTSLSTSSQILCKNWLDIYKDICNRVYFILINENKTHMMITEIGQDGYIHKKLCQLSIAKRRLRMILESDKESRFIIKEDKYILLSTIQEKQITIPSFNIEKIKKILIKHLTKGMGKLTFNELQTKMEDALYISDISLEYVLNIFIDTNVIIYDKINKIIQLKY